jgi:hypothetical protein
MTEAKFVPEHLSAAILNDNATGLGRTARPLVAARNSDRHCRGSGLTV